MAQGEQDRLGRPSGSAAHQARCIPGAVSFDSDRFSHPHVMAKDDPTLAICDVRAAALHPQLAPLPALRHEGVPLVRLPVAPLDAPFMTRNAHFDLRRKPPEGSGEGDSSNADATSADVLPPPPPPPPPRPLSPTADATADATSSHEPPPPPPPIEAASFEEALGRSMADACDELQPKGERRSCGRRYRDLTPTLVAEALCNHCTLELDGACVDVAIAEPYVWMEGGSSDQWVKMYERLLLLLKAKKERGCFFTKRYPNDNFTLNLAILSADGESVTQVLIGAIVATTTGEA